MSIFSITTARYNNIQNILNTKASTAIGLKNPVNERASDDIDLKNTVYNPHNLFGVQNVLNIIKKEKSLEMQKPLEERKSAEEFKLYIKEIVSENRKSIELSFDSSQQTRKRKQQEKALAIHIHNLPVSKQLLFDLSRSIVELFEFHYKKNAQEKINEAFKFYRKNQSGAVSLEDNPHLKYPRMKNGATFQVLCSSLTQTLAIGENKVVFHMFREIEEKIKALKKAIDSGKDQGQCQAIIDGYKDRVDIELFSKIGEICGRDANGLPDIEAQRLKLYKEGGDINVRTYVPPEYPEKYSVKDLVGVTEAELRYIREEQNLPKNMSDTEKNIVILPGSKVFYINSGTDFFDKAKEIHSPTTSGPSGTQVYIAIAEALLEKSIKRKQGLSEFYTAQNLSKEAVKKQMHFDEDYYQQKLLLASKGYLAGPDGYNEHHSMAEVQQGDEYSAKIKGKELDTKVSSFEEDFAKSKLLVIHNNSVSLA